MWKNIGNLLIISVFMFATQNLSAQFWKKKRDLPSRIEMIETNLLEPDTMAIVPKESMIHVEIPDTIVIDTLSAPDEDLNELFSEKMDSMVNSSYIRELFHFDYPEMEEGDFYPKYIPD